MCSVPNGACHSQWLVLFQHCVLLFPSASLAAEVTSLPVDTWLSLLVQALFLGGPFLPAVFQRLSLHTPSSPLEGQQPGCKQSLPPPPPPSTALAFSEEQAALVWLLWAALQSKTEANSLPAVASAKDAPPPPFTATPSSASNGNGSDGNISGISNDSISGRSNHSGAASSVDPNAAHDNAQGRGSPAVTTTTERVAASNIRLLLSVSVSLFQAFFSGGASMAPPLQGGTITLLLRSALQCLRLLVMMEPAGREGAEDPLPAIAASEMVPALLTMLYALGPPGHKSAAEAGTMLQHGTVTASSSNSGSSSTPDDATCQLSRTFTTQPYEGFRRDVVAVLANCCYQRPTSQDAVRRWTPPTDGGGPSLLNGLLLVLQQCVADPHNPTLREWGLWSVRNLIEDNKNNQAELLSLEMAGVVPDPHLRAAGLEVVLNEETGRPRLRNISQ